MSVVEVIRKGLKIISSNGELPEQQQKKHVLYFLSPQFWNCFFYTCAMMIIKVVGRLAYNQGQGFDRRYRLSEGSKQL